MHLGLRAAIAEAAPQQQRIPALRGDDRRARHRDATERHLRLKPESAGMHNTQTILLVLVVLRKLFVNVIFCMRN